jgi:hypothetical protein
MSREEHQKPDSNSSRERERMGEFRVQRLSSKIRNKILRDRFFGDNTLVIVVRWLVKMSCEQTHKAFLSLFQFGLLQSFPSKWRE